MADLESKEIAENPEILGNSSSEQLGQNCETREVPRAARANAVAPISFQAAGDADVREAPYTACALLDVYI